MKPTIIGIGTACPPHSMSQEEALKMFDDIVCAERRQSRLARALFKKSNVENRHTVVHHRSAYAWAQPAEPVAIAEATNGNTSTQTHAFDRRDLDTLINSPQELPPVVAGQSDGPSTAERMSMYANFASGLALQSAELALHDANIGSESITHLVLVTCTGFDSPGVDVELINRLGLPTTTQRINIGFMGCHGAVNGLRAALAIIKSDKAARVLLCCVELCSLHYRFKWDGEGVIGNALFADGSASLVVGYDPQGETNSTDCEFNDWTLIATGSVVIPDSMDSMSWKVGDHGFEMLLTNEVGEKIEQALANWLTDWLTNHGLALQDIDYWGVHPGGPRILDSVQASLSLSDDDLRTSRHVLARFGNMSSPTVLFILQQFMNRHAQESSQRSGNCVVLAFGPGLVAEIALIRVN